jgi:hypothetical protein
VEKVDEKKLMINECATNKRIRKVVYGDSMIIKAQLFIDFKFFLLD